MRCDTRADQAHELRVHVIVVVGDAEANDLGRSEMAAKRRRQPPLMRALHHEDDVDSVQVIGRQRLFGVRGEAGRRDIEAGLAGEDGFRGRAAPAIAAADEEDALQAALSRR